MRQYFYAPVFVSAGGPRGARQFDPGYLVGGELASAVGLLPPRTTFPVCDKEREPMRFLVCAPLDWLPRGASESVEWSPPDDWVPVSLADAATAYPGRV